MVRCMIYDFEFYHGAALARLVHCTKTKVTIRPYPSSSNASYILNEKIGLYIKHSSSRMTPWKFSFDKLHQNEILEMRDQLGEIFIALVCNKDGIACLSFDELKKVLNEEHDSKEWIKVSRRTREKYQIKGSDGTLFFKIGDNEFPNKLIEALSRSVTFKAGITSWLNL